MWHEFGFFFFLKQTFKDSETGFFLAPAFVLFTFCSQTIKMDWISASSCVLEYSTLCLHHLQDCISSIKTSLHKALSRTLSFCLHVGGKSQAAAQKCSYDQTPPWNRDHWGRLDGELSWQVCVFLGWLRSFKSVPDPERPACVSLSHSYLVSCPSVSAFAPLLVPLSITRPCL